MLQTEVPGRLGRVALRTATACVLKQPMINLNKFFIKIKRIASTPIENEIKIRQRNTTDAFIVASVWVTLYKK